MFLLEFRKKQQDIQSIFKIVSFLYSTESAFQTETVTLLSLFSVIFGFILTVSSIPVRRVQKVPSGRATLPCLLSIL